MVPIQVSRSLPSIPLKLLHHHTHHVELAVVHFDILVFWIKWMKDPPVPLSLDLLEGGLSICISHNDIISSLPGDVRIDHDYLALPEFRLHGVSLHAQGKFVAPGAPFSFECTFCKNKIQLLGCLSEP